MMEEINFMGGRTSRMRKIVEQMSNPIFGSYLIWNPKAEEKQQMIQRKQDPVEKGYENQKIS